MTVEGEMKYCIYYLLVIMAIHACNQVDATSRVPTARVEPINFKVEIDTVGTLDADRSHTITSPIRGDKGKIIYLIKDGQKVVKDEVLVRLDPAPYENEVRLHEVKVKELEAGLQATVQLFESEKNQAEQSIKSAEFNLKVAKLELSKIIEGEGPIQLARYKEEMEQVQEELLRYNSYVDELKTAVASEHLDLSSEIYLAEKKMAELQEKYKAAKNKYVSYESHVLPTSIEAENARVGKAEMELRQIKKGSIFKIAKAQSDVRKIEGALDSVKSALEQANRDLEQTVIKAPFEGIVILSETFRDGQKRKSRVGDTVFQNQPIMYLPDISSMLVNTTIREVDLYKISIGQPCTIKVDAFPHTEFSGKVNFIGALATEKYEGVGGSKFFQLSVIIKGSDNRLRPGMTGRVTILVAEKKDTLTVPIHGVFGKNEQWYCLKKVGGEFVKTPVLLGESNNADVEVLSGLAAGDEVSLVEPAHR
ncbi:MAG: efflux RND transporter periplasmic adaptor subunit [Desulfobulbaceae bacterium]|nr:efflux RND transporter periplasmic adaptor subunit [Desulfobulbaceae bacterium]